MQQTESNQKTLDKIVKIWQDYKKVYNVFFKYIFFIITVFISILIAYAIINNTNKKTDIWWENRPDNWQSVIAAKQNFEKQQKLEIKYQNIEKLIIWDKIYEENNKFISNNNLLSLQWIILPKHILLKEDIEFKNIKYFSDGNYDKAELEKIVNTIILNENIEFESVQENQVAAISNSINDTFSLNCLDYTKVYNEICNHYINEFIENFFFYDISKDYNWFKQITEKLSNKKNKICENIEKYLLYTKDSNINKNLFLPCWAEYIDRLEDKKLFIRINNDLNKRIIDTKTYKNKYLNYYKLLSSQQIIFKEFSNGKIPIDRITKYSNFLLNLIKSNSLENFYLDEAYYFNNYYLVDQINKFDDYSDEEGKRKIYNILQGLNNINYWNKLESTKWLKDLLTNKDLIKVIEITEDIWIDNLTWRIEILSKEIENSNYLIINSKKIDWYKLKIIWYIKILNNWQKNLIDANIELEYNWQTFIVKKILTPNIEKLNWILENFISKWDKNLQETYSYIKENLWFYGNDDDTSTTVYSIDNLCNQIKARWTWTNKSLSLCTNERIVLNNWSISYEFKHSNYIINEIKISNDWVNKEINENFWWIKTNQENILSIIMNILTYNEKENIKTKYIDIETVGIIERLIGPILDFAQSGNKLIFETNIKWIDFIIWYNKERKQIWPIYFKNILINTRSLIIKNAYIRLNEIDTLKKLKSNPLEYIKLSDKSAYFIYQMSNK